MSLIKGLAYTAILAGIGVLLNGEMIHVGIILLIEGGVLFTIVDKNRGQGSRSRSS